MEFWKLGGSTSHCVPNSGLSAMYNQCRLCSNTTIIAFQDQNGIVQIGNLTSAGWTLTRLELTPHLPTGLALQPFYRSGMEDQINLYYQNADLSMNLACWVPAMANSGGEFNPCGSQIG